VRGATGAGSDSAAGSSTDPMTAALSSALAERLATVRAGVADAAQAAGRDISSIITIAVTKFHPAAVVRELAALGVTDFGESRHQEAQSKTAELSDLELRWHFVGQLQSKKARQVRVYAQVIHSIDRDSVIDALASPIGDPAGITTDCFIQLNLTPDERRGGVGDTELERLAERVVASAGLRLLGVMAVAPLDGDARRAFARVREASELLRTIEPSASFISAGMSGDYREAILEGATHLRIGTAITGNRPLHG
jgi:pyridoxal phosphate enzyme (YggS family)